MHVFPFYWGARQPEPEPEPEESEEREPDEVNVWRYERLLEAGWDELLAGILAVSDVDLHRACELLKGGCDQATAWEIVRPW